jgi:hypothetical protein
LLAYLHQRNLVPGREIRIVEVDDVAKTLRIHAGQRKFMLSHETAAKVWAVPAR